MYCFTSIKRLSAISKAVKKGNSRLQAVDMSSEERHFLNTSKFIISCQSTQSILVVVVLLTKEIRFARKKSPGENRL